MKTSKVKVLPSESSQWTKNMPTLQLVGYIFVVPNHHENYNNTALVKNE